MEKLVELEQSWLPSFDKCSTVIQDVNNKGNRVRSIGDLSVLSLQCFCASKIVPT